jgi:hypothetical protein
VTPRTINHNKTENTMKTTLTTTQAASMLADDQNSSFSRLGAYALVEYLEQLEEECGEEMEFDSVALRCDYSEYDSALDCAVEHGWNHEADILDADDNLRQDDEVMEENEEKALRWLQDRAEVIEFDGGVIVSSF